MTELEILLITIMTLAAFVRGAFGFADALVAMPLLLLLIPTTEAAPLMALVACLIALVILTQERSEIDVRAAAVLIVSGIIGVPIGIWVAGVVDQGIARGSLGAIVIAFSTWSLLKPEQGRLKTDRAAPIFGFAAGVLGGAFNTAGPPLVFFAALRRWPPQKFRATMQAYTIVGSSWVIAAHVVAGNVTTETWYRLGIASPFIAAAALFGRRFTTTLATERFIRLVYWLLIFLGLGLIATSLL